MLAGCGAGGAVSAVPMEEDVAAAAVVGSVVPRLVDVCLERVALVMAASVETAADRTANVPAIRELVASLPAHVLQRIVCHLYKECLLSDTLLALCLVSGVTQLQLVPAPDRTPLDLSPSVLCAAGGRCADTLTTLIIRESSWDDGRLGLFVSAVAGRLETLDLCLCVNVSSSTIAAACAANRRTLRYLNIGWCFRPSLDGRALQHLAKCSQLETVVLSGHPLLETDDLKPLLALPRLQALALKGCTGITDLPTRLVTNLTSLNLGSVPLPASSLARILKGTPAGLRVLKLAESQLSPRVVDAFLSSRDLPLQLESLDLSWCDYITEECVVKLCCQCPNLTRLRLRTLDVSDASLIRIAEACPRLVKLVLPRCSSVSDATLVAVGKHCHRLEMLDVSWCSGVSEAGIEAVFKSCPLLRSLKTEGCKAISAAVVDVFVAYAGRLRLRHLDFGWVNAASSELVWDLLLICPWLEVLDYYRERFVASDVPVSYAHARRGVLVRDASAGDGSGCERKGSEGRPAKPSNTHDDGSGESKRDAVRDVECAGSDNGSGDARHVDDVRVEVDPS